ncbi:MAG TPA: hypothetical protein VH351_19845 [Bryobacteraceae bacterium]|jgi:predicted dienelactone hydrolase|nr:hypothetical protein [Bryobacteraceae bacterium]
MRVLELLIFLALVIYLLWISFDSGLQSSLFSYLPFAAAALTVAHLLLEGARWQLAPLYCLVAFSLATFPWLRSRSFQIRLSMLAIVWAGSIPLFAAAAVLAGTLWPVFPLAPVSGPYQVGVINAHLIDRGRLDPYSPGGSAVRELMVEVWYPAASTSGFDRARYRDGRQSGFKDSQLPLVKTRSFAGPPLSGDQLKYPIVIFSGPLNRFQNTYETEDLASHGFIVVSIDHPYDSDLVVLPDGRRLTAGKDSELLVFTSEKALAASRPKVERRLAIRVGDVKCVLDQLEKWNLNPESRFYKHLDLAHIAMIGHSFGGATAAEVCTTDARVRVAVNFDGTMFGASKWAGVPKPYLVFFTSERPTNADLELGDTKSRLEAREVKSDYADIDRTMKRYGGYFIQVPQFGHMNFTDTPLYSQLKIWTGAGKIGARRAHEIVNVVTLAFLRKELLGQSNVSVEGAVHQYGEVHMVHEMPPVQVSRVGGPYVQ